jgi:outer membrane protein assembly factor BamE (lipoprotein component of BamABCDE complex)
MTKLTEWMRVGLWLPMFAILVLTACTPAQRFHGYAPTDIDLASVEVGRDTRDTVTEKLGRPGVGGVMNGSGWYYVQSDWVSEGWRAPVEVDRQVVAISFDSRDRVSNVERFGLQDGQVVALSRRITQTGPAGQSFLRQIFNNLGNFGVTSALAN